MARVTVEDGVDKVSNRFDLVLFAAQRARQISGGAELTIDRDRDKNPVVALREDRRGNRPPDHLEEAVVSSLQRVQIDDEEAPDEVGSAGPNRPRRYAHRGGTAPQQESGWRLRRLIFAGRAGSKRPRSDPGPFSLRGPARARPLEALRDDEPFDRALAAGRGLGVLHRGEIALHFGDQRRCRRRRQTPWRRKRRRAASICASRTRSAASTRPIVRRCIGLRVADRIGGHVRQDQIGRAAQRLDQPFGRGVVHEIHLQDGRRRRSDRPAADRCRPPRPWAHRGAPPGVQPPGAMPRSTTRFAPLRKSNFSSSSISL